MGGRPSSAARRAPMKQRVAPESRSHVVHALLRRKEAQQPRLEVRIVSHSRKELRALVIMASCRGARMAAASASTEAYTVFAACAARRSSSVACASHDPTTAAGNE